MTCFVSSFVSEANRCTLEMRACMQTRRPNRGKRQVSIGFEIQGGNGFNSAQAANPTSGVSLEEEKDSVCPRRKGTENRKAESGAT